VDHAPVRALIGFPGGRHLKDRKDREYRAMKTMCTLVVVCLIVGTCSCVGAQDLTAEQTEQFLTGLAQGFAPIYQHMTGFRVEDHDMRGYIKSVKLPTLMLQVRNDMVSRASDIQWMYDNVPVADKKLIWVEGTPWRFYGYTYFAEHPEEMLEWYDSHM
jgi:esterase/lipase